jgi:predicted O-methyltransferase YrrM
MFPLKLTIGMAVYDDYDGAYFTVQALRMYHAEAMKQCEIIVVDNNPGSTHSKELQGIIGWWFGCTPEAKAREVSSGGGDGIDKATLGGFQYIQVKSPKGTAVPRNKIFEVAKGEFVLVLDPHILFPSGTIDRLLEWINIDNNSQSNNLYSGPLMYDGFNSYSTHFDYVWRGQMWGVWGSAWVCPCSKYLYSPRDVNGKVAFYTLERNARVLSTCPKCRISLPTSIAYNGHQASLIKLGFRSAADDSNREPFEIPANGLGVFLARKDSWLGFNDKFRGFGGEECYIHDKYRLAGRKTLCLPFLRWLHRFGRPGGAPYKPILWDKIRNYVIGYSELGLPLTEIKEHFVDSGLMPVREWEILTADPNNPPERPLPIENLSTPSISQSSPPNFTSPTRSEGSIAERAGVRLGSPVSIEELAESKLDIPRPNPRAATPPKFTPPEGPVNTLGRWVEDLKVRQHDFKGHEELIRGLASQSKRITELGGRRGSSTVLLLSGQPEVLRVIDPDRGNEWDTLIAHRGKTEIIHIASRSELARPEETDLLLIDTNHHADQLYTELNLHGVHSQRVIIHDTILHGQYGENNKPGLIAAIKEWVERNPDWFVSVNDRTAYGLTVLSRIPSDRPKAPILMWSVGKGPGTELKKMLSDLGINPSSSCDCNTKANQMDAWGVQGCKANRDTIIGWLRGGQVKWGWMSKFSGISKAVVSGLAFKLNPLDPYPSLVDEAIRRAEAITRDK